MDKPSASKKAKPGTSATKGRATPGKGDSGKGTIAAAAGVAATAAGVGAAVAFGDDLLGGDDDGKDKDKDKKPGDEEALADDSMDAFDDVAGGVSSSGGGGGGTSTVYRTVSSSGGSGGGGATSQQPSPAQPSPSQPSGGDESGLDPAFVAARAKLLERLEAYEAPGAADTAAVEELKADLRTLVESYRPVPGQTVEQALAMLEHEFDGTVKDFVHDTKIELVIKDREADAADPATPTEPTDPTVPMPPKFEEELPAEPEPPLPETDPGAPEVGGPETVPEIVRFGCGTAMIEAERELEQWLTDDSTVIPPERFEWMRDQLRQPLADLQAAVPEAERESMWYQAIHSQVSNAMTALETAEYEESIGGDRSRGLQQLRDARQGFDDLFAEQRIDDPVMTAPAPGGVTDVFDEMDAPVVAIADPIQVVEPVPAATAGIVADDVLGEQSFDDMVAAETAPLDPRLTTTPADLGVAPEEPMVLTAPPPPPDPIAVDVAPVIEDPLAAELAVMPDDTDTTFDTGDDLEAPPPEPDDLADPLA